MTRVSTSAGLALGFAADAVFGDPVRGHPVALFGNAATWWERRVWADRRSAGLLFTGVAVGVPTLLAAAVESQARRVDVAHAALVGVCTWAALGGRSLRREGHVMAGHLGRADVVAARRRLGHLCSRDAANLESPALARATVESLAENTCDAVTAPLLWGAVGGATGIVAYRAVNTLDAMVGYRSDRYRRFGWAAARLDDVLNYVPSRLTAALTIAAAPLVGGRPKAAWHTWRRDAWAHPSPNAGPVEATAAGALGVRLGGTNSYGEQVQDRGILGDGRDVAVADIDRCLALTRVVGAAALGVAVGCAWVWRAGPRRRRG